MFIIVNNKIDNDENEESLKKSKYIIYPKCKESERIFMNKYKIEIYECKNGHKENYISINDCEQTQNIDESKIKCQKCQEGNKSASFNKFFIYALIANKIYVNYVKLLMIKHII